jgi:hypothetical protein
VGQINRIAHRAPLLKGAEDLWPNRRREWLVTANSPVREAEALWRAKVTIASITGKAGKPAGQLFKRSTGDLEWFDRREEQLHYL